MMIKCYAGFSEVEWMPRDEVGSWCIRCKSYLFPYSLFCPMCAVRSLQATQLDNTKGKIIMCSTPVKKGGFFDSIMKGEAKNDI